MKETLHQKKVSWDLQGVGTTRKKNQSTEKSNFKACRQTLYIIQIEMIYFLPGERTPREDNLITT